jgi:hypothetical protein
MRIANTSHRTYWYLIGALSLTWVVGGEQFWLPVVIILLFLSRLIFWGGVFLKNASIFIWFMWLISIILSLAMIDENYRYLSWTRNFIVALSGVLLSYLVYESHRRIEHIRGFLYVILWHASMCALAGFMGILGVNFEFMSFAGNLIGVRSEGYLHDMFIRSFVQAEVGWFSEGFIRPKGLMLYANLLSGVILVGSAIKVYILLTRKSGLFVILALTSLLVIDGVVVLSTLSRSAWLGLAVGILSVLTFSRLGAWPKFILIIFCIVLSILALAWDADDLIIKRFVEKANSNEGRFLNYTMIFDALTKDVVHFFIGYGTQREVAQLDIPLGSHSTYLGLLYKYGALGFSLYIAGLIIMLTRLQKAIRLDQSDKFIGAVLLFSLVQIIVQSLFIEMDVDVVYSAVWWLLVGLALAYTDHVRCLNCQENH